MNTCKPMRYFMYIIFIFINFCEQFYNIIYSSYQAVYNSLDKYLNNFLEGHVLYYGLYGKDERFYAVLYDYTSFWNKCYAIIFYALNNRYTLFHYNDVFNNIEELSNFFVDCAVVAYVDNGDVVHKLVSTSQDKDMNVDKINFVYVLLKIGDEKHDITHTFTKYKHGILSSKNLIVEDITRIVCKMEKIESTCNEEDISIELMSDNSFEEMIFKSKDIIYNKFVC